MINFLRGHPSTSLLATKEVLQATQSLLTRERPGDEDEEVRHPLAYGSDPGPEDVRQLIIDHVLSIQGSKSGKKPSVRCVTLTNGASYGLLHALIGATSGHSGFTEAVYVASPTYFLVNHIFLEAGFRGRMVAVPDTTDTHELDIDFLERDLESRGPPKANESDAYDMIGDETVPNRKLYRFVLYLVPTFSNPTGTTMNIESRQRLIDLARKHDILIVTDDVYDLLTFDKSPQPPTMVQLDRETGDPASPGNTVSNGSFSKLVGPGIRVGWVESPTPWLAIQVACSGAIRSGGTPSQYMASVCGELLRLGLFPGIVAKACKTYGERAALMRHKMAELFPQVELTGGNGGYFIWAKFPHNILELVQRCKDKGVVLAPGSLFKVHGSSLDYDNCLRMSFSYMTCDQISQGLDIVSEIYNEIYKN